MAAGLLAACARCKREAPGFLDFVVSKGSLQAIARLVEKYPAVYGSWRIGKGGQPARAAQDLFGGRCRTLSASTGSLRRARQALPSRGFVMSATGGKVCPNKGMNWWTDHHAYSVLEAGPQGILVRNPWATTLSPRWMSEQTFMSCMGRVYVCQ